MKPSLLTDHKTPALLLRNTILRYVSAMVSTILNARIPLPSTMSSSRKRRVPARMRRTERPRDSIPDNDNADAQYIALLLREEELIEAVRMVNPKEASEMEENLDKVTRVPWSKLEQSDKSSDEVRLDRLHSIERTRNEAEKAIQKDIQEAALRKAHKDKIREQEARLALQSPQKLLNDAELTEAILVFIRKKSRPQRCPHKGEFSWSRKVYHIKQQFRYDEKDKIRAREIHDEVYRYGYVKTVKTQFWSTNHELNRYSRRLPDDLAWRPLDAITLSNKREADYALRLVAQRIWIIVTHADDEDEYQRLF